MLRHLFFTRPRFVTLGQIGETGIFKNVVFFPSVNDEKKRENNFNIDFSKAQQHPKVKILRFDESLYACNAPFFKRKFYELIGIQLAQSPILSCGKNTSKSKSDEIVYKFVVLECSPFNYIDTVGVKLLIEVKFCSNKKKNIEIDRISFVLVV